MTEDVLNSSTPEARPPASGYRPPAITYLGSLAEMTQKTVGAADGATFLGLDIGTI